MTDLDKLIAKSGEQVRRKAAQSGTLPDQHPSGGVFVIGDTGENMPYPSSRRTPAQLEAFRDIARGVVAEFCRDPQAYLEEITPALDPNLDLGSFLSPGSSPAA